MKKITILLFALLALISANAQWLAMNTGLTNTDVRKIILYDSDLYVGTGQGVYRSTNGDSPWTAINNGITNLDISTLKGNDTYLFAGTFGDGVFKSVNNGDSWTLVDGVTNGWVHGIGINGSNVFVSAAGIFLSTDNGNSWTESNTGLTSLYLGDYAFNGTNTFVTVDGSGVFLSINNGSSWTEVNNGLTNLYVSEIATLDNKVFVNSNGISISNDNGGSWSSANTGLTTSVVRSFLVNGMNIFAGTDEGVFISSNGGNSWTQLDNSGLLNSLIKDMAVFNNKLYAATGSGVYIYDLNLITNIHSTTIPEQNPNIYPNPTDGDFSISDLNKTDKIVIIDSMGRIVYEGLNEKEFSLNLDAGLYVVKIGNSSNGYSRKLVIK